MGRRVLLVQFGHRPNELMVKKLAMLGCVAMVLAHSIRERPEQLRINAYAGGRASIAAPGMQPNPLNTCTWCY